jgi:hypothetical protein
MTEERNRDAQSQARQDFEKRTVFTEIFNLFSLVGSSRSWGSSTGRSTRRSPSGKR